ncbi:hypothetical protein [Aquimarina algiphila]|uniref:Uncharacterized protein n=1 Tax=Aquimarina algiphila TaxID=2047982 RepID=A0A554VB64_9FLAO|nr:hypothetical protein [Aquimarina algiphila]TSE03691.1 hypothetical protein FOF46_28750 [Aquimarina algiphila]
MKKDTLIITGAGLVIGTLEALIYYNMGKKDENGKFSYSLPPTKEFLQTVGLVFITSIATAYLTKGLEKVILTKSKPKLRLQTA